MRFGRLGTWQGLAGSLSGEGCRLSHAVLNEEDRDNPGLGPQNLGMWRSVRASSPCLSWAAEEQSGIHLHNNSPPSL